MNSAIGPSGQVLAPSSERVIDHGCLTDEELNALYHQCRMEPVSLCYGGAEDFLMMGETGEALKEQIVKHYDDTELLVSIAGLDTEYVRANFSEAEP